MKQISFRIRKDRLLKCMGALGMALTLTTLLLPANAFAVVCCLGDGGGVGGSCPSSNNACNNADGCLAVNQSVYYHWVGMQRCTVGVSGCNNNLSLLCKQKYNCQPGCGPTIGDPQDIYECGCATNGHADPSGNSSCSS